MTSVVITGSRKTLSDLPIREAIAKLPSDSVVAHGGCNMRLTDDGWEYLTTDGSCSEVPIGADAIAHELAVAAGLEVRVYAANWEVYGKQAGPARNTQMLSDARPDVVLAFPSPQSRGTWDCVRKAKELQIPVILHRFDG